jgi:hypothetical protein
VAVCALAAALAAALWARRDTGPPGPAHRSQISAPRHDTRETTTTHGVAGATSTRAARPAAFKVRGAPTEPLDEIALPARARRLDAWLSAHRGPSAANQRHWLYQHAWIVTGANFGWWHGAEALRLLIRVDRRIESRWRIGYRSEAVARRALASVEAKAR